MIQKGNLSLTVRSHQQSQSDLAFGIRKGQLCFVVFAFAEEYARRPKFAASRGLVHLFEKFLFGRTITHRLNITELGDYVFKGRIRAVRHTKSRPPFSATLLILQAYGLILIELIKHQSSASLAASISSDQ